MAKENTDDTPIQFIVKEKSLIGNELFEAGAVVTLPAGTLPADNMEATDARGQALKDEYTASNKARVAAMQMQFGEQVQQGVDPVALSKAIAAAVADALASQAAENKVQSDAIIALQAQVTELQKPALA